MYAKCTNCDKPMKTANGAAFHASWCKPAEPVAALELCNACDLRPMLADNAAGYCAECFAETQAPSPREFTFHPGDHHRSSAVAETADDAAAKIGAAFGPLPAHAIAYVAPLGPSCLNVGPETARILFPPEPDDPRMAALEAAERLTEKANVAKREKVTARRMAAKGRARAVNATRPLCLLCRANYRDFTVHATSARHLRATRPAVSRRGQAEIPAWTVVLRSMRESGCTVEPEPVWDGIPQAAGWPEAA